MVRLWGTGGRHSVLRRVRHWLVWHLATPFFVECEMLDGLQTVPDHSILGLVFVGVVALVVPLPYTNFQRNYVWRPWTTSVERRKP